MHELLWITIFGSRVRRFANNFHGWRSQQDNKREAGDPRRHRAHYDVIVMALWRHHSWSVTPHECRDLALWRHIHRLFLHAQIGAKAIFYSERPRGAGFRSVNPAERWRENPARALAREGFSQHLECGIHRSESSPEGSFALIPHPVARWAKTTP